MPKSSHFSSITSIANKNNDSQVNSSGGSLYFKRAITLTSKRKPSHNTLAATNASVFLSTQQTRKPKEANIQERPTTAATSTKRAQPSKRIMAITKGRGVAIEIGICIFDVGSGECIVSQLADSQTFTRTLQKVNLNDPQKILVPLYAADNASETNNLMQLIQLQFPHISIVSLSRKYFNDEIGKQHINEYGLQEDAAGLLVGLSTKYYCLAAISGTFHHIFENEGYTFAEHTIKFTYQGAEGTMMIDTITAKNLELIQSATNDGNKRRTLLGVLDCTKTPMGNRLLRMNILQPPCSCDVIKDRLDAVEALSKSEESAFSIQSSLKQLTDLDHIISYIVKIPKASASTSVLAVQHAETKVNEIIGLKQSIKMIKVIADCVPRQEDECILLDTIYKILSSDVFGYLSDAINNTINEEVGLQKTGLGIRNQKCYAVKAGVNGLLDVARQTYKETTEDIYELMASYNETYKLKMKLEFSASNGFYIIMANSELTNGQELPSEFINVIEKKRHMQFTSLELLQKNSRINESLTEVYLMSDRIVTELFQVFRDNINVLYKASEAIALLDMLTSLAQCNLTSDYVRPEFSNTLAVKSGRHPILDSILAFPLISNDVFASLSSSFQFITGPNMSGKSTYLRQIALLNIMAQIGSFVPAEYASFRLNDQLLSRLANDNSFTDIGTSSFMSEMRETAYLLHHVTSTSIVIIDELGRGTSPSDALGITASVCEDLIHSRAFCFFATHLHELTHTLDIYPNVVNLQFKVNVTKSANNDCTVDYQYKIEDGNLSTENHYGLQTAQLIGYPKQVLSSAYKIVTELKEDRFKSITDKEAESKKLSKERKLLWFADKILQLGQTEMSNEQLHEQVYKLQNDMLNENDDD